MFENKSFRKIPGYLILISGLILILDFIPAGSIYCQLLKASDPVTGETVRAESFFNIQKKFSDYLKAENIEAGKRLREGFREKVAGYNLHSRWEYYWEQRVDMRTGNFPNTDAVTEYTKSLGKLRKSSTYSESWVNLGTNTSAGGYAGLGRINCIAFHPADANIFWAGSPSGGLWKTTNGGSTWTIQNDNQAVLGVSDIVVSNDYTVSNTIYIATGDRDGGSMWSLGGGQNDDNASIGVLKSTDGGNTWMATGLAYSTSEKKQVYRILQHPSDPQTLLASTTDGIFKSTNGGISWVQKSQNMWIDMEFKPGDPSVIYASSNGYGNVYINKSTDNGETWNYASIATGGYRGELAVSAADPAVVYLLACNNQGGLTGVYKSVNSGSTYSAVFPYTTINMMGYYTDGSGVNTGQGYYDLCIAASPSNADLVYIGGINTWKSTNGGTSWSAASCWTTYYVYNKSGVPAVHADKHCLVFRNGTTLFEGNDGGIYRHSTGGTAWTDLTNGMIISQIYRIGISKTDPNVVLAGLQDNGSKKFRGAANTWMDVTGGDGMECIVDNNNATSYMYATYVRGEIYRNSNGFSTTATTTISANIPGGQPAGAWVTPYIMDPSNSAVLYAGYDRVWKTADRGNTWTQASQVLSGTTKLRSLAIAPSNTNYLYAADLGNMWKTADAGATNWSAVTLPSTATSVTYIAVKNNDPNIIWISYGGFNAGSKVYRSADGGTSWTNISSGLPNIPVMCVIQYTAAPDREVLFAGTDAGVYVKNGSNDWEAFNSGLPNVVVTELEVYYDQASGANKLRAGTYGRGLWETAISSALPVQLTAFNATAKQWSIELKWSTATEVNSAYFILERSTDAENWNEIARLASSGNSNAQKNYGYADNKLPVGKYFYRLKSVDNDGSYEYSKMINAEVLIPQELKISESFPNPFNPETRIKFEMPNKEKVRLSVFNQLGEEVAVLVDKVCNAGIFETSWNAQGMPSGIYYMRIMVGKESVTRKLLLLK